MVEWVDVFKDWRLWLFRKRFNEWLNDEDEIDRVEAILGVDRDIAARVYFSETLEWFTSGNSLPCPGQLETGGYRGHKFWSAVFDEGTDGDGVCRGVWMPLTCDELGKDGNDV